jgi:hypothetical protein
MANIQQLHKLHELIESASDLLFDLWVDEDDMKVQQAKAQAELRNFLIGINPWDAKTILNTSYLVDYDIEREFSTGMSALTRGIYNTVGWSILELMIKMGSDIHEKFRGESMFEFYMSNIGYGIPFEGVKMFVDNGAKITSEILDMAVEIDKTTSFCSILCQIEENGCHSEYCFSDRPGGLKLDDNSGKVLATPYLLLLQSPPNG